MERQESLGAAGGLYGESLGGATMGVPRGIRAVETGSGLPSEEVLSHSSGRPLHSGEIIIRSRPSEVVAVRGSGPSQQPGEVVGNSLASNTYPGGFNAPFSGNCVSRTSGFGSEGPGVHNSGCSPRSGSTSLHLHKPYEDRPRSILKNSSSTSMRKSSITENKKSQHWDEMNIMATYHPANKDYGFMKVDEPSTPYTRLLDSGPPHTVTPEALAERFATMDNFSPKVLQYSENSSSGSSDNFPKTHSSDFEKRRKAHYNEGKFLKAQKNLPLDSSTSRSQSPTSAFVGSDEEVDWQRKEYYSKGRYLRSCPHPELEEDTEDEDSSTNLIWANENSIRTEVRLLDHTGSPLQDHRPSRTP